MVAAGDRDDLPRPQLLHPDRLCAALAVAELAPPAPTKGPARPIVGGHGRVKEAARDADHSDVSWEYDRSWWHVVISLGPAALAELVAAKREELTSRSQRCAVAVAESDAGNERQCELLLAVAIASACGACPFAEHRGSRGARRAWPHLNGQLLRSRRVGQLSW